MNNIAQLFVYLWETSSSPTEVSVKMGRRGLPMPPLIVVEMANRLRSDGVRVKANPPSLLVYSDPDIWRYEG